jgi:arylsulfatase
MAGWDEIRARRHKRQLEMGIVKKQWGITPRDEVVGDWANLSEEEKKKEDLMMAVYAAMVDRVDQNIGRLVAKLKAMKKFENTLFLFLSDNGGCPFDRIETPDIAPGPAESYWSYNTGWAQVSNTPFRLYKRNQHEGGISTPLIAHWPGKIKAGSISDEPGQIVDIMATLIDISGARRPKTKDGQQLRPLRGLSLVPVFQGKKRDPDRELFFTFSNYRALRIGKWKVSWKKGPWELYDIEADRCELNDLALEMPEKVREMSAKYDAWLKELGHAHKVKGNN